MNNYIGKKGIIGDDGILENVYHIITYKTIKVVGDDVYDCSINIDNSDNFILNDIDICYNNNTFSLKNYNDNSENVIVEIYTHSDISNETINNGNNTVLTFTSLSGEKLINIDSRSIIQTKLKIIHGSYGPIVLTNKEINFNDYYNLQVQINYQHPIVFREIKLVIKIMET